MSWPRSTTPSPVLRPSNLHHNANFTGSAQAEVAATWRLLQLNWFLLAVMLAALDLALLLTAFRIRPMGYLVPLAVSAVFGLVGSCSAGRTRERPWISCLLTGIAQMTAIVGVMTSMTYIAAANNFPLQDEALLAFDRAVGFNFRAIVAFVNDKNWLIALLALAYRSIGWQSLVIAVLLPLTGRHLQTTKYILVFFITLIAHFVISIFVPAIGAYGIVGLVPSDYPNFQPEAYYDTLRDLPLVRSGALRVLDLPHLGGIVTFPSFHAAAAAIYIWALWPVRFLRWLGLMFNIIMLLSAPIGGGHFLADVIAGIAIVILSITAVNQIASRLLSDQKRSAEELTQFAPSNQFGGAAE
jgi:PAP2 superfamily protein